MTVRTDAAQLLVERVVALCDDVFGTVESLRTATATAVADALPRRPQRGDLAAIETIAAAALLRPEGLVVGAGFVAEPGALRDETYWLEWWTYPDAVQVLRLAVESDPDAPAFRDYTRLPWFQVPRRTGRRQVTGPYVDYLCTDEYTLTFTAPVVVAGRFAGVVGADVFARTVELRLGSLLGHVPEPAAIVNAQGRVVAGNEGAPVTGDLLREVVPLWDLPATPGGDHPRLYRCGDLPFALVVGV